MKFIRKRFLVIGSITVFLIIFAVTLAKIKLKYESVDTYTEELVEKEEVNTEDKSSLVYIDIKGEINQPGIYKLAENKRVMDVIEEAGGLTDNADTSLINLSKKVTDQMVIIIYSKEEVKKALEKESLISLIDNECNCPNVINDSCINSDSYNNNSSSSSNGKVSLNSASKEALMTVPGVGETKASAIIEYRKISKFESVEDLLKVNGIGSATYEKIKDYFIL